MRTTEDEGDKLETPSDDEEITIPSQDSADIRNVDIHGEQSENTQREDWLLPTEPRDGLARDRLVRSTLRQWKIQYSGMWWMFPPSDIRMGPSVCRQEGRLIWKRKFSHLRGGRQVHEPQGVQSEARAVPRTVPEDTLRNSGKGQRNFRSPIEILVNTVSHMQRDLAILRD